MNKKEIEMARKMMDIEEWRWLQGTVAFNLASPLAGCFVVYYQAGDWVFGCSTGGIGAISMHIDTLNAGWVPDISIPATSANIIELTTEPEGHPVAWIKKEYRKWWAEYINTCCKGGYPNKVVAIFAKSIYGANK